MLATEAALVATSRSGSVGLGRTFEVDVVLSNNPGLIGLGFDVIFDSTALNLLSVTRNPAFGLAPFQMQPVPNVPVSGFSPQRVGFANLGATANDTSNGRVVTLLFEVLDNAPLGNYTIGIALRPADTLNFNRQAVGIETADATISVTDVVILWGDVDGDGEVTFDDAVMLFRHVFEWPGYEVLPNPAAGDVDLDGELTFDDAVIIFRHVFEWPGYEELPQRD